MTKKKMARPRKQLDLDTYEGRFAWRLKALRERAGLTVEEAAENIGVVADTLYSWERGRTQPKISDFPTIAKVLGVKKILDILPRE